MRALPVLCVAGIFPLLSGCIGPAMGPNYTPPALNAPLRWMGVGHDDAAPLVWDASATQALNMPVWDDLHDPTLSRLIQDALTRNGTLKAAMAQVDAARGARLTAQAATLPTIGASAAATRAKSAQTGDIGTSEQANWTASWELDLFGANRRAAEAARAALGGAQAEARLARVRLVAEVVNTYLDARAQQAQVAATRRSVETQDASLRMMDAQVAEGVASGFSLQQAVAQRADTRAQLPLQESQLQATLYSLGALTGHTPAEIMRTMQPPQPVPVAQARLLLDAPAAVLAARPDVAIAERALAEATANTGAAMASWLPKISLSGLFGVANTTAHPWSAGANASVALLDFGRVRGLVRQADARQKAALATYEQTVLNAMADVETALTAYMKAQERAARLRDAATANATAYTMAQAQAKEGVISTLDLLTVEQKNLAAQSAQAAGDAAAGQALAALYKALGGQGL